MNDIALNIGDARLVNMVALGAYAAKTGAVQICSLETALKDALPERNHKFIPVNIKAIEAGAGMIDTPCDCAKQSTDGMKSSFQEKALTV
jgi:2-oxoglutarate ferredoxin oxidoreductase subunit gamma